MDPQPSGNPTPQTRRERGVINQREYRKRHASKVQALQLENRELKDAVHELDAALGRHQALLPEHVLAALNKVRELAGLSTNIAATRATSLEQGTLGMVDVETTLTLEPETFVSETTSVAKAPQIRLDPFTSPVIKASPTLFPRVFNGSPISTDAVPADTVAGTLFWSSAVHVATLFDTDAGPGSTQRKDLDRIFNRWRIAPLPSPTALSVAAVSEPVNGAVFQRLCESYQRIYDGGQRPRQSERDEDSEYNNAVINRWWRTHEDVETYLEGELTGPELERLRASVKAGDDAPYLQVFTLLSWGCFVLADGPRWSVLHLSMSIGVWLKTIRNPEVETGAKEAQPNLHG